MATSAIMRREAADDRLLVTGIIVCLAVGAALLHFFVPINHDEAYLMALAGRLLDGGQFGKDIMDMNPPHVWWISAMPVWFARQIGLRLDVAASVFTVAMAVLSVAAVARLTAQPALDVFLATCSLSLPPSWFCSFPVTISASASTGWCCSPCLTSSRAAAV